MSKCEIVYDEFNLRLFNADLKAQRRPLN